MADRSPTLARCSQGSIVVAVASGACGRGAEYGRIANTAAALDRLLRKLGVDGTTLQFCYEAGPCG